VFEPVPVRLRGLGGDPVDVQWHGNGDDGEVVVETPGRMWQATIDPERELIEDRRDDNAAPFAPQVVLDSAEVDVSSTEFGVSGLFVGRNRYDYRKDLGAVAFYSNRSVGFTFGPRWHGGTQIDATRYEHNAYLFYAFQALDSDFSEDGGPETPGNLGSIGLRYDYTNVYAFDNPTNQRSVRLFADWFDSGLGGDYNYIDWGLMLTATHPLWSYRRIGAVQIVNGFTHAFSAQGVPNQGQYSLGGSRSIRGMGVEDELGRNILLMRAELRQDIFPELDWNMLDLLVVRRHQLRMFVDSGRVEDSAGRIYDISGFAVGVGVGVGVVYDFLGFFPALAYFEVATRVDRGDKLDDVQFLFGSRQAF
jgi:outer membrane protein assembly factor BamA